MGGNPDEDEDRELEELEQLHNINEDAGDEHDNTIR